MLVIMVGPPGSGKSAVGRVLADRLDVGFEDLDALMQAEHGLPAGELVVEFGRERFQELEVALLKTMLVEADGVLALGGGTPTAPGAAELLAPCTVIFLDVDLETLLKREGLVPLHPWLLPNPRAHLRQLLADRRPVYEAVASHTVLTVGRSVDEIVEEILGVLAARP